MQNPSEGKQQSSIFYAITVNDIPSIKQMADGGWALPQLQDTAGKTALHRAAQMGNTGAGESARPDAESTTRLRKGVSFLCVQGRELFVCARA